MRVSDPEKKFPVKFPDIFPDQGKAGNLVEACAKPTMPLALGRVF